MPRGAIALALLTAATCSAQATQAQEAPASEPTAEQMIERARELYRPPGVTARCIPSSAGEIVVCAPDPDAYRLESPTDQAIRTGQPVYDVPRAPAMAPPPCDPRSVGCIKFGNPPQMPPMVDYSAIPEPLTPEEAARVFRAEDPPSSAAASPAEAP